MSFENLISHSPLFRRHGEKKEKSKIMIFRLIKSCTAWYDRVVKKNNSVIIIFIYLFNISDEFSQLYILWMPYKV